MNDYDLNAEVLKIGNHGFNTSTSPAFIKAVNPIYAILSYGTDNQHGHPHGDVYDRLMESEIDASSTPNGTIEMSDDGRRVYINQSPPTP
ncbi:metallo-beta-lactamase [Rossellomorea vietnamensis]|uniref:Metallo-beta-lactamase n=1 Tax=Rossellomorea vietnamensis TaxID=218284 RepID=A0A5D4LYW5_9BACI|nr:metallo-beta-lactamase [Rossellomorea vietnamensis]TYR94442.1 metallo-beta-lactamase [Rossellomorea vietnamensis]